MTSLTKNFKFRSYESNGIWIVERQEKAKWPFIDSTEPDWVYWNTFKTKADADLAVTSAVKEPTYFYY